MGSSSISAALPLLRKQPVRGTPKPKNSTESLLPSITQPAQLSRMGVTSMASAHITVSGFLARDAEVDATPSGTSVLKLTIPVNNPKDRADTSWYGCSLFGKRAD